MNTDPHQCTRGEFKLFYKQEAALEYIASAGPDFRIFSRERKIGGSRVHQVYPSCQHFANAYQNYEDSHKTFYEVIPVGYPVKLFFDLEFPKELNLASNGPEMVDILLTEIQTMLEREFSRKISLTEVIRLDASTPVKFSHHLVFPQVVFVHLVHCKMFIERLCRNITATMHSKSSITELISSALDKLYINTGHENAIFVDKSVYGRKQNFRIFMSNKFGKVNPLLRAAGQLNDKTDEEVLLASLITNIDKSLDPISFLEYPDSKEYQKWAGNQRCREKTTLHFGPCPSAFPHVDAFFQEIIRMDGRLGVIRKWEYESDKKILRYFVEGEFRYCENIGKDHENEGVIFIIDLRCGEYFQRCREARCKDFRPARKTLPKKLLEKCDLSEKENLNII